jgi:CheY-like chemotaxis protein
MHAGCAGYNQVLSVQLCMSVNCAMNYETFIMERVKALEHTIFCIDDDPDDLNMLRDVVKGIDKKYSIMEARNGAEGLKELHAMKSSDEYPCLIVLDINMPKMDGKSTFLSIKADPRLSRIPIVIFSTSSNPMDKMFFAKEHVEYFVKPVNFQQLVEVATKMLSYCA